MASAAKVRNTWARKLRITEGVEESVRLAVDEACALERLCRGQEAEAKAEVWEKVAADLEAARETFAEFLRNTGPAAVRHPIRQAGARLLHMVVNTVYREGATGGYDKPTGKAVTRLGNRLGMAHAYLVELER